MFAEKAAVLFENLGENKIMVLATSESDAVTARSVSVIICDRKFYFQTDIAMTKAKQISANPRVAICCQNYQIEGVCRESGHPLEEKNRFFRALYQKHFEGSYQKYSHMENERVFEVVPAKITVWDYDDGKPYRDYFDFIGGTYKREYYDIG